MASSQIAAVLGVFAAVSGITLPKLDIESRDYRQAEGGYAAGSLVNADRFQETAEYSVKLFRARERGYAAAELVSLMDSASRGMRTLFPKAERVQLGDFSRNAGGDIDGHGSHENGLDVDVAYFRTDARELDPATATEFPIEYVNGGKLSSVFDLEKNLRFLQLVVSSGLVNRIFVDPVIKVRLCEHAASIGERGQLTETLRRLRPWPHHGDHFHVRLVCPKGSSNCAPQAPVVPGDGCAEALGASLRMYPTAQGVMPVIDMPAEEGPGC